MEVTNVRLSDGKMVPFYVYEQSMRNVLAETEKQLTQLKAALKELCEVKIIRDVQGKTPEYEQRKRGAWAVAFSFFPEYRS